MKGTEMAEQTVVVDPVGEPNPSEATPEPWEKVGLTKEKYAEVFAELKSKVDTLRPEARKATELEAKLATYEAADEKRKALTMSELEKARDDLNKSNAEKIKLQADLDKSHKDNVYERVVSKRLVKAPDDVRELIRDSYDLHAKSVFADEDELNELLDKIDTKWKAHMDAYGGENRPDVGGGTRGKPNLNPASPDEVALAEIMGKEGVAGLLKRKFTLTK